MNVLKEHLLYWNRIQRKMQGDHFFYNIPIVVEERGNDGHVSEQHVFDTAASAAVFLGCSEYEVARAVCTNREFEVAPGKTLQIKVNEKSMQPLGFCMKGNLLALDIQGEKKSCGIVSNTLGVHWFT